MRRNRIRLLGAILFGGMIGPVLFLLGLRLASAASVSLWLNLELVATALLGRLLFHDHLGGRAWAGVCGAVLAGGVLSLGEGAAGLTAGSLVALACVCWGVDNHLTALIDGITPSQSTLWKGLGAGSANLVIGLATASYAASALSTGLVLLIGALCYGASITLYIRAAHGLGATRAQTVFAAAPFFGAAIAVVLGGDSLSASQWVGALLLAASIALLVADRHEHSHAHDPLSHAHAHCHDDGHHVHVHPGQPASLRHTHWHDHERLVHSHPHWPDLHHRHEHQTESAG